MIFWVIQDKHYKVFYKKTGVSPFVFDDTQILSVAKKFCSKQQAKNFIKQENLKNCKPIKVKKMEEK